MYARVVRFTDVDPDHLASRIADVDASGRPPVDIPAKGIQILHDPDATNEWQIKARVDVDASTEAGRAVLVLTTIGRTA